MAVKKLIKLSSSGLLALTIALTGIGTPVMAAEPNKEFHTTKSMSVKSEEHGLTDAELNALIKQGKTILNTPDFELNTFNKVIPLEGSKVLTDNSMLLRSVPQKVVVTSTSYTTDYSNIVAKSPIGHAPDVLEVSYTKSLSASLTGGGQAGKGAISAAVGFDIGGSFSTTGGLSRPLTGKEWGHLELYPRYKIVKFDVYMKSRRPVGGKNPWVKYTTGTAKKPDNLIGKFIPNR